MFFIDALDESDIWRIGDFVGKNREKLALARADITKNLVSSIGLVSLPDQKGHARHVNVGPWPVAKDEQKAIALEFCAHSTLSIRPN